jgi:hypothetical protein
MLRHTIDIVLVFIIRFAERRVDQIFDSTLLDYCPPTSDIESVKFESEWSFFKSLTSKKRIPHSSSSNSLSRTRTPSSPPTPGRPLSPTQSPTGLLPSSSRNFSSLGAGTQSRGSIPNFSSFLHEPITQSPSDLTSFLTALHTFLSLSKINPAFIVQLWSQVMYWTSSPCFTLVHFLGRAH